MKSPHISMARRHNIEMPILTCLLLLVAACTTATAQNTETAQRKNFKSPMTVDATVPELCAQYAEDKSALERLLPFAMSDLRLEQMGRLHSDWISRLEAVNFSQLPRRQQIDWLALYNKAKHDFINIETTRQREHEVAEFLPFTPPLVELLEARANRKQVDAAKVADIFHQASLGLDDAKEKLSETRTSGSVARRATKKLKSISSALENFYRFRDGYDPAFGWWCQKPWEQLKENMNDYGPWLERELGDLDPDDKDALIGDPIGREALLNELAFERIPYAPGELIQIAEKELAWCNQRRVSAAERMGLGDDWKAAQAAAKDLHVEPGDQPEMILQLAEEAVAFLETNDLVSIPDMVKKSWRMEMMSPARQMISPYFTGGEVISIAFPTDGMSHEAKLQSMRGNNQPYSHATVHHELIPGHHLQGFMAKRWNPHRRMFYTPFLVEGWALYWELQLWDWGFAKTPEEEIGMLFWRSHRCARIIFSLNFHLGNWSPQECVDFLVETVGHELRNAEAEVRRSIQGGYGPLYQCAYMLGGMQLRSLYKELVEQGGWNKRDFHDAVLHQGPIPVDLIRAALGNQELSANFPADWRFND